MAQQTINIGASPNDGTGTPLRTAFQYTNSNFSELYTAVGPSGNNIVVPGSATITGDLTVDTSTLKVDSTNNRVGIGTASPATDLHIFKSSATDNALIQLQNGTASSYIGTRGTTYGAVNAGDTYIFNSSGNDIVLMADNAAGAIKFAAGGNTESMTLNSTGLGVGASPSHRLTVSGTAATNTTGLGLIGTTTGYNRVLINNTSGGGQFGVEGSSGGNLCVGSTAYSTVVGSYQNYSLHFITNNNVQATIDPSGNVGIGVTPSAWLTAVKALDIGSQAMGIFSGGITHNAYFDNTDNRWEYKGNGAATYWNIQNGVHQWYVAASGIANNPITTFANAAMTLDASGNLLVARTGAGLNNTSGVTIAQASIGMQTEGNATQIAMNRTTSDGTIVDIRRNNSTVGTIAVTTAGTTYNSISDYRLKEAVQPLAGGLARVNALKPSIYKWKSNGSSGEGFIAHELAEVVPAAVTGEKDAVNEDGTVNPQGVDLSKVVPILVAAIKELTAEVNALKNA